MVYPNEISWLHSLLFLPNPDYPILRTHAVIVRNTYKNSAIIAVSKGADAFTYISSLMRFELYFAGSHHFYDFKEFISFHLQLT